MKKETSKFTKKSSLVSFSSVPVFGMGRADRCSRGSISGEPVAINNETPPAIEAKPLVEATPSTETEPSTPEENRRNHN